MKKIYTGALCAAMIAMSASVDCFQVSAAPVQQVIPEGVSVYPVDVKSGDFTAVWNIADKKFNLSYKVPTEGYYYPEGSWSSVNVDLETVTKVVFYRSEGWSSSVEIATVENPAPGSIATADFADVELGTSYSFSARCYVEDRSNSSANVYDAKAGAMPAPVSNATVETTKGATPITVSFDVPSTYSDGVTPITAISRIVVTESVYDYSTWDDVIYTRGTLNNPTPGSRAQIVFNDAIDSNSSHTWKIVVEGGDGESEPVSVSFFLGNDYPNVVTNLKAVADEEGKIHLSWDAPATGARNGYIDPAETRYTISTKPSATSWDKTQVVTDLAETSYVYTPDASAQQSIVFSVVPFNSVGTGQETCSDAVLVGPADALPYVETFNTAVGYSVGPDHIWSTSTTSTASYPTTWSFDDYVYIGSTVKPRSGEGGFADIRYYSSGDVTYDYLVSGNIELGDADAVQLSFCYYAVAGTCTSTVGAQLSFDGGQWVNVYHSPIAAEESKWVDVTERVEVPAGAHNVVIRMFASNGTSPETVVIDDIKLEAAQPEAIVYPSSVTNFTSKMNEDGTAIDIALTAPTVSHPSLGEVHGEPLTKISRIVLYRNISGGDYKVIHTFENPAPGAELTFSDTDLAQGGSYFYRAVVYVGEYCDYGEYVEGEIMVGQRPADVTNLALATTRGEAPVVVSFNAPAVDVESKQLTENVDIVLSRYDYESMTWSDINSWSDVTPGEYCSFNDANVVSGNLYQYQVKATGRAGASYGVTAQIYVGVDTPLSPENVNAEVNENDNVVVTWTAPTGGVNNGYIDVDNMTYMIYRGNGYSDYEASLIASDVKDCRYVDTKKYIFEENVRYFVKAVSNGLESYSAASPLVTVGPAATLPFTESFNSRLSNGNITADHSTWTMSSTEESSVWGFAELAYFILEGQKAPYEGDGLAYCYYGPYSTLERHDYLTSGHISLKDAVNPKAEYYVYVVPGYDTQLSFEVSTDGVNFEALNTMDYATTLMKTEGWVKVECDLSEYVADGIITVRFNAFKGTQSCSTAIDALRIYDEASSVKDLAADDVTITVNGSTLSIVCPEGTATAVYTVDGMTVMTGEGSATVELAPAMYIVKAGNRVAKVAVK